MKDIIRDNQDFNFSIQTFYVPSSHNPADEPSRDLSDFYAYPRDVVLTGALFRSLFVLFDAPRYKLPEG